MNEFYRLAGTFTISEEKRNEFNLLALELLNRCGIRLLKDITVAGNTVTVISHISPDSNGIVSFNYSIFEHRKRDFCHYDMNTCELSIANCGFSEFGMALMLLLTMKESYSETRCYLSLGKNIVTVNKRALIIENILGIRLKFPHRADVLSMYFFSRENPDCTSLPASEVMQYIPYDFIDKESATELEAERGVFFFYQAINRESEDDFLGVWENRQLILSYRMKNAINNWTEQYKKTDVPKDYDMESKMTNILTELKNSWNIKYVDEEFIIDFLSNAHDLNYQKGLLFLAKAVHKYINLFPELTKGQAMKWIIKGSRSNFDYIEMKSLLKVLSNKKVRTTIFGF